MKRVLWLLLLLCLLAAGGAAQSVPLTDYAPGQMIDVGFHDPAVFLSGCTLESGKGFILVDSQFYGGYLLRSTGRIVRDTISAGIPLPEGDSAEVTAQDETPYQTMEYNQLALQLFQMGFFRSDMAEQALRCLELMQFRHKETLTEVIRQGQKETEQKEWLTASLRQAVALLDKAQGTHLSETLEQELRQRDSGVGKTNRRVNGAVERQRQATRQAVRPR